MPDLRNTISAQQIETPSWRLASHPCQYPPSLFRVSAPLVAASALRKSEDSILRGVAASLEIAVGVMRF